MEEVEVTNKGRQKGGLVVLVASVAAIAGILFGFDTGVISGAILFIKNDFTLTPFMNGLIVSAVLLGALMGSAVSGRFADRYGRRRLLIITAFIFIIGTLASALADSIMTLYFGRVIVGVAIGIASYTAPLYISEVSPANYRGMLVSLNQLAITIGIMLAYVVDAFFAASESWRWMFAMGVIPAIILFFGMLFLPQSPRWLLYKGYFDSAKKTLQKIRETEHVDEELNEIKSSFVGKSDWRMLFKPWVKPAIIICLGLGFFQQATGINTIIYYAPTIFEMAGFKSALVAILATAGVGLVNVLFTIIALPLIDRWGRRPLLIVGVTGMLLSLAALSLAFYYGASSGPILKWTALGSMLLYIACFAISLGPIMWLMFAEVFPLEIRGLGSSLAVAASWGFNGIVALTFLPLVDRLGASGAFIIYSIISVLGLIFVITKIPETKGVSLERIEMNLRKGVSSRHLGD
jgi:sugar porter (SP) family MFS transporter